MFFSIFFVAETMAQQGFSGAITGTIKNANNEPVVGVLLVLHDTPIAKLTDSYGRYYMTIPSNSKSNKVVVSAIGYDVDTIFLKPGLYTYDMELSVGMFRRIDNNVYVSTQKRRQASFEVPISLSVTPFNKIENLNIIDPQELSLFSPGYHNQTQSGVYSVNVIRGVASDGSNSYSFFQPRISVFQDGVSVTHMGTASQDIFDMNRVEVVKGPQGTLFGKGAEFGAVSYVTNKPVEQFEANLQFKYGNYNQKIMQGVVNTPIGTGNANRLAFYYNDRNGYNTNLADNSGLSGKGAVSVRDIFKMNRNNVEITVSADYEHNSEPCVSYKGVKVGVPGNSDDVSPFTPAYFNEQDLYAKRDMGGLSYTVEHALSPQLYYSSITAVRAYKLNERYDLDGTYLPLMLADEQQKGLQVSEEVRFNWRNSSNTLDGFVGASYMFDRNEHSLSYNTNLRYAFPYLIRPTLDDIMMKLPDEVVDGVDDALDQVMSGYYKMLPQYANQMQEVVGRLKSLMATEIKEKLSQAYSEMFDQEQWDITPDVYGRTSAIVYDIMVNAINTVFESDPSAEAFTQYIDPVTVVEGLGLETICKPLLQYSNLEMPEHYEEMETDINIYHEADVFADVTFRATKRLFFTLGVRGTVERQKTSYCSNSDEAPLVGAFMYHSTQNKTHWLHDLEISWVGRAVANYMITPTNNFYLSLSKGRRPGSIYYNFAINDAVKLRPETSINYEVGLKGNIIKNHLLYSLAAYYYDWLNFQSSVSTAGINGIRTYQNSDRGKANAMGAEASVELILPKYFSVFGDYSYIDAKFTDKDSDGKPQKLASHRFRMTPKHSADFGYNMDFDFSKKVSM